MRVMTSDNAVCGAELLLCLLGGGGCADGPLCSSSAPSASCCSCWLMLLLIINTALVRHEQFSPIAAFAFRGLFVGTVVIGQM